MAAACPDENQLTQFVFGGVTAATAAIERHLDECEVCRVLVAQLLSDSSFEPIAGQTQAALLTDRYVLGQRLGSGAMGVVYQAHDAQLDREVALKVLRSRTGDDATDEARLVSEAQALAKLSHANVVQVYDVGRLSSGNVFIALELVEGQTLAEVLGQTPKPWRDIVRLFVEAGRGLQAIHDAGLVHRDFKPANVLVGRDGRVRLSDLGLAGLQGDVSLSAPGGVGGGGTPAYLAPERISRQPATAASDQFAFCIALYEALVGARPFAGASLNEQYAAMQRQRPKLPAKLGVPSRVARALERGLSFDPAQRYPSMTALLTQLEAPWWSLKLTRRFAAAAAVLALAALSWLGVRASQRAACAIEASALDASWSTTQRRDVEQAFARVGGAAGAPAFQVVSVAFDAFRAAWAESSLEVCLAKDDAGAQAMRECLGQRRADFEAMVALYAAADQDVVLTAPRAVQLMAHPSGCRAAAAAQAALAQPDVRSAQLRQQLAKVAALQGAGKWVEALSVADEAAHSARQVGSRLAQAELAYLVGFINLERFDFAKAQTALFEAAALAQQLHQDELLARAYLSLARRARLTGQLSDANGFVQLVTPVIERAQNPQLQIELLAVRSGLAQEAGALEQSIELAQRALELARTLRGPDDAVAIRLEGVLSQTLFVSGRLETCEQLNHESLARRLRVYGPEHPEVAKMQLNLAAVLGRRGKLSEAAPYAEQAIAVLTAVGGPANAMLADATVNTALIYHHLGDYPHAADRSQLAQSIAEKKYGRDHPKAARLTANRAEIELYEGHLTPSLELYADALARFERADRLEHVESIEARVGHGWALLLNRQPEKAAAEAERALAVARRVPGFEARVAEALELLAEVSLLQHKLPQAADDAQQALSLHDKVENAEEQAALEYVAGRALSLSGQDRVKGDALLSAADERALPAWRRAPQWRLSEAWLKTVTPHHGGVTPPK